MTERNVSQAKRPVINVNMDASDAAIEAIISEGMLHLLRAGIPDIDNDLEDKAPEPLFPLDANDEEERRYAQLIEALRREHGSTFKSSVTTARLVLDLDELRSVHASGGGDAVAARSIGMSKGYWSKRLIVGRWLLQRLGEWTIFECGLTDFEIVYQAARAVMNGVDEPADALAAVKDMTRREASAYANGCAPVDLHPLGSYQKAIVDAWKQALEKAATMGVARDVLVMALARSVLIADEAQLRSLVKASQDATPGK